MSPYSHCLAAPSFQIRFKDLLGFGRELVFPCDSHGRVDLDALSERSREQYFFARAMVGRGYSPPRLEGRVEQHEQDDPHDRPPRRQQAG